MKRKKIIDLHEQFFTNIKRNIYGMENRLRSYLLLKLQVTITFTNNFFYDVTEKEIFRKLCNWFGKGK